MKLSAPFLLATAVFVLPLVASADVKYTHQAAQYPYGFETLPLTLFGAGSSGHHVAQSQHDLFGDSIGSLITADFTANHGETWQCPSYEADGIEDSQSGTASMNRVCSLVVPSSISAYSKATNYTHGNSDSPGDGGCMNDDDELTALWGGSSWTGNNMKDDNHRVVYMACQGSNMPMQTFKVVNLNTGQEDYVYDTGDKLAVEWDDSFIFDYHSDEDESLSADPYDPDSSQVVGAPPYEGVNSDDNPFKESNGGASPNAVCTADVNWSNKNKTGGQFTKDWQQCGHDGEGEPKYCTTWDWVPDTTTLGEVKKQATINGVVEKPIFIIASSTQPLTKTMTYTYTCTNGNGSTIAAATVTVGGGGGQGQPDLTAGGVTPTSGTIGQAVTYKSVVNNQGDASTTSTGYTDLFEASYSADGSGAFAIGTHATTTPVSPQTIEEPGPSLSYATTTSSFYMRVCADMRSVGDTGQQTESDEGNNCGAWTHISISAPDLYVPGLVSPTTTQAGADVQFTTDVKNIGTTTTGTGFTDVLKRAKDGQGGGAAPVSTSTQAALNAGDDAPATITYQDIPVGTFYLAICADQDMNGQGTITESNENNNCGEWTKITVSPPPGVDMTALNGGDTTGAPGDVLTFTGTTTSYKGSGEVDTSFPNLLEICGGTISNPDCNAYISSTTAWIDTLGAYPDQEPLSANKTLPGAGSYVYRWCANTDKSWNHPVTEEQVEGSQGDYPYNNNCSAWANLTVATPPPSCTPASQDASTTDPVTWTASGGSNYKWYDANGTYLDSGPTLTQTYDAPATYGVEVVSQQATSSVCYVTVGGCEVAPIGTLNASPTRVATGSASTLSWTNVVQVPPSSDCKLVPSPGGSSIDAGNSNDQCQLPDGHVSSGGLTTQTQYTLECGGQTVQGASAVVDVAPSIHEF